MIDNPKAVIDTTRTDYTVKEVSRLLKVDQGYLRRLLIQGVTLKGRKIGNTWVMTGADLVRWVDLREVRLD